MIRLLAAVLLVAGCALLQPRGGGFPEACESLGFDDRRCAAIVDRAIDLEGLEPGEVAAVRLITPPQELSAGGHLLGVVGLTRLDGTETVVEVRCGGVGRDDDRVCREDAQIGVSGTGVDMDVPCAGEAPAGCATQPSTPRPKSVAAAVPLVVPSLDIPLGRVGHYELRVGEAGLADGYLTERTAEVADRRPADFWIDGGVRLEVRPVERGRPPVGSRYRDPYDGVEPVEVFLVFDVSEAAPGAVLQVRDIVVR